MSDKDFAIGVVGLPQTGAINRKPCHLIKLDEQAKNKKQLFFLAFDKPDLLNGFIQVKGIFCDGNEDDIAKNFAEIQGTTSKELILDIMFPCHKINWIRSLVFNANKPSTLVR